MQLFRPCYQRPYFLRLRTRGLKRIQIFLQFMRFGKELMKRGIQQANGNGVPLHRLKNADKILPLHDFELVQRADAFLCCIGNHHFLHDRQAILLHKHMFRSAQPNALRPKIPSACSVRRGIRIGPNLHRCKFIRQHEKIPKIIGEFRLHQRKTPQRNDTEGSVQ